MLRQVLTLSSGSALGKLFGVVREVLFAAFFGTSAVADAYRAAMAAVITPIHLLTSESLSSTFIPQFRSDRKNNSGAAWALFNGIGALTVLCSIVLGIIIYFFASTWVTLLFPGFAENQFNLTVQMLKIMAWGVPLYSMSALLISLEIGSGRFALAASRAFVQNIGIIIAILLAVWKGNSVWIAWGFTGTYTLFAFSGTAYIIRKGILESNWYSHWKQVKEAFNKFWISIKPLFLFSLINQVNILLEKAVASLIGPGSVAAVEYARLIPETSQVLLIVPLGLVSLSSMSTFQESEVREYSDKISSMVLLLLVPLSSLILVAAPDIIRLLYGRGAFDENSIHLTSMTLRGMSVGAWAVCLAYVLQKIYNARIRNREVLRIGFFGILANVSFIIVAYRFIGILAIGIGYSLYGIVMAGLYVRGIGGLKNTGSIAVICFLGFLPYCAIAFLFQGGFNLMPLTELTVQTLFAIMYWALYFWMFPLSRNAVKQLISRLAALKNEKE